MQHECRAAESVVSYHARHQVHDIHCMGVVVQIRHLYDRRFRFRHFLFHVFPSVCPGGNFRERQIVFFRYVVIGDKSSKNHRGHSLCPGIFILARDKQVGHLCSPFFFHVAAENHQFLSQQSDKRLLEASAVQFRPPVRHCQFIGEEHLQRMSVHRLQSLSGPVFRRYRQVQFAEPFRSAVDIYICPIQPRIPQVVVCHIETGLTESPLRVMFRTSHTHQPVRGRIYAYRYLLYALQSLWSGKLHIQMKVSIFRSKII